MAEMLQNRPQLFDSIQVAFFLTDSHSKILCANQPAEDLFGYRRTEIEGKRLRLLFLDEDLIYLLPNVIYLTLYQDGFRGELLLRHKDGTRIFVLLHTTSFKEKGETYMTFSFQEIHRLKNLERERLEEKHWTRLGRMVEEIAHQVRNPVVSIGGYAHRLLKGMDIPRRKRPYLTKILYETGRLERMIQQVEDYIQIPSPSFRKEGILGVVEEALQTFSKMRKIDGVTVRLETRRMRGEGDCFIARGSVIKALLNLLENSLEAVTAVSGKVREAVIGVTLFEGAEVIGVSISDNGQGIGKKDLPLIWEPFYTTRPGRVGLGLTIVKRIIETHAGRIQIKSQLKKGTAVTLYFLKDRRRRLRREFLSSEVSSLQH